MEGRRPHGGDPAPHGVGDPFPGVGEFPEKEAVKESWGPRAHPSRCCDEWEKRTPEQAYGHEKRRWREIGAWLIGIAFFIAWALGGP